MRILFDGWHMRAANQGGGIARDASSIAFGLQAINGLKILRYKNQQIESSLEQVELAYSRNFIRTISMFGFSKDIKFETDLYWISQILPLFNSKAEKTVVRIHDLFPLTNTSWFPFFKSLIFKINLHRLTGTNSYFVANSSSTAMELLARTGVEASKIRIFPCRVQKLTSNKCRNCEGCRNSLNLSSEYFLMVGTIEPRKNYSFITEVFKGNPHLPKLIVVGRKGWKSKKDVRSLQKHENIQWLDSVCDGSLLHFYLHAKAFISTSLNEGFNLPAAEAYLYNVPLILSDIPIHREFYPEAKLLGLSDHSIWSQNLIMMSGVRNTQQREFESDDDFAHRLRELVESLN